MVRYRDTSGRFKLHLDTGPETIIGLYADGISMSAIAREVSCNAKTVAKVLKGHGVTLRKFTVPKIPSYVNKVIKLYRSGLSIRECAKEEDVSPSVVRHWLKKLGIERRSISEAKKGQKPAQRTINETVRSRRRHYIKGKPLVGYKKRADGYVDILVPGRGYVREHRLIMERHLNRELTQYEEVHHLNGIKDDNHLENLVIFTRRTHHQHHYKERKIDKATGRLLPKNS